MQTIFHFIPKTDVFERALNAFGEDVFVFDAVLFERELQIALDREREGVRTLKDHPHLTAKREQIDPRIEHVEVTDQETSDDRATIDIVSQSIDAREEARFAAAGKTD